MAFIGPTRLSQYFRETGCCGAAGDRHFRSASGAGHARFDEVYGRHGAGVRRQGFSVLLHYYRLRRGFRISCADLIGHHAEADCTRDACAASGLWRNAAGKFCRDYGHGGGERDAARGLLRGEFARGGSGQDGGRGGGDDLRLGIPRDCANDAEFGAERGRNFALRKDGRSTFVGVGDGAYFFRAGRVGCVDGLLVSLRHHVRGVVHSDHHRRRDARGPLYAAGHAGAFVEAVGAHELDAGGIAIERGGGLRVGLLSL